MMQHTDTFLMLQKMFMPFAHEFFLQHSVIKQNRFVCLRFFFKPFLTQKIEFDHFSFVLKRGVNRF